MSFTSVEQTIANFFVQREGKGILEEIRKLDFFEQGILDSLDVVFLATTLRKNLVKKLTLPMIIFYRH